MNGKNDKIEPVFIINPAARTYSKAGEALIRTVFPSALIRHTQCHGDGTRIALEILSENTSDKIVLVPCGGDGTFREVAQAVGSRIRIAIGPMGTVNQIGAQLGTCSIKDTLSALKDGVEVPVYPGLARFEGEEVWRMFFIGVSAGPDADAVGLVNKRLKKIAGGVAYAAAFFRRMARGVEPVVECTISGTDNAGTFRASQVIALANGLYGGKFMFASNLGPEDTHVEVAHTNGGRFGVTGFFLASMVPGKKEGSTIRISGGELVMRLPDEGDFQIDGDAVRARAVTIRPSPEAVRILVPRYRKNS